MDESPWQESVVQHLSLRDWRVLDHADGDTELLAPEARSSLRRRGVLFPAMTHLRGPLQRVAAGGLLLDGEGGDEVLGSHRCTVLLHPRELRRRPRAWAEVALDELSPRVVRARRANNQPTRHAWWTPRLADEVLPRLLADTLDRPWRSDHEIRTLASKRSAVLGLGTLDAVDAEAGVQSRHPLLEPEFLAALAAEGGALGWPSRTAVTAALAGSDLPANVVHRHGKVEFSSVAWGPATRAFAERWDGHSGVDPTLVHPEALRVEWLSERPHPSTAMLVQSAWLAQEGG